MTEPRAPRLDRIAIGIDFSELAREGAAWALGALAPDAELLLVHALDLAPGASLGAPRAAPSATVLDAARDFAEARLRAIARELGRPDARIELREGRPAPAIASAAEAWGADLIVVGPHGERAAERRGLGTTAERLVRISPIPVLLAGASPSRSVKRLLVPVDEVDLTAAVLEWAALVARREGADVTLVHVLDPHAAERPARGADATEAWLAELASELPPPARADRVVATGTPGEEILDAAGRSRADLVILGRRGRGRVLPGVLGSTVSVVLRDAPCPVLVVVDAADAILDEWGSEPAS
ncbi:MAG TPA: universal stress protein [Gemmatimonadaceae bacterium]|nr:universal stress protein [Gemmatimonadaceae bacterium]